MQIIDLIGEVQGLLDVPRPTAPSVLSLVEELQQLQRTASILSSITSTCRRHQIDTQHYFTQLLANLPATPTSQLEQWLPEVWKRRHDPATIADAHATR